MAFWKKDKKKDDFLSKNHKDRLIADMRDKGLHMKYDLNKDVGPPTVQ